MHRRLVKTLHKEYVRNSNVSGMKTGVLKTDEKETICHGTHCYNQGGFSREQKLKFRGFAGQIGISNVMCSNIINQISEIRKLSRKWVSREFSPGQMEMRVMYSTCNLRYVDQKNIYPEHRVALDVACFNLYL